MSRSLRRGSIAAIAAIAIASLSSCAAGTTPDTLQIKPDNAAATLGTNLRLNNIVIVTGVGTSGDYTGPANLVVNISNTAGTPAELQSITVGSATATFADAAGAPQSSIVVPAGGSVMLGGQGNPSASFSSASVHIGGFATTTFAFKDGQKVDAQAGVSPDSGENGRGLYKGYGPTPAASASTKAASPAASAPASPATPSAGATTPGAPATPATPSVGATVPGAPVAGATATATAPAAH
ncbi:DUF461 domain-containing protein [Kitasatospora cathayae]|uniref:DUF461 domain-containing protein n=1 Tax=Kitasatospora cathayae TaxID=3004092 RepID=A0ABY7Q797_9ACTN|nr:DUF461 domain-containing protein [Kitasatospora sp. HUAS 3-15]WBP88161.1 DUF461 domain-containing protein [Kitasatospora sp. HUAS 3-15]